jgi:Co/Zn/Cd efflux system component
MSDCCGDKASELEALRNRQSSTLKIVLGINAAMFLVELIAGILAGSVSLVADSLDMLGDALVYGFSIYVVARSSKMKAVAAMFKGGIMAAFGLFVLGQAIYKMVFPQVPGFETIALSDRLRSLRTASACICCGAIARTISICIPYGSVPETT